MTDLDPVIHSQGRLRIMTTLTALPEGDRITFPRLQALLGSTAGNLSTHLRKLEDAGYVEVVKGHQGRVPSTHLSATRSGRRAFEDYLETLHALLTPPSVAPPTPVPPTSAPPALATPTSATPVPSGTTTQEDR